MQRCSHLAAWASALGWQLLGAGAMKARVQLLQGCQLSEELYPNRLTYVWREPHPRASLLLVQHGRCIVETGEAPVLLRADGRNAALLPPAATHRLTLIQAPCRLVRVVLPPGSSHPGPGPGAWQVDLGLMLPMLRLLEQALHHPGGEERRGELGATLLGYLWHQLAGAGCAITLAAAESPADDAPDAALLPRLERWLAERLEQPLQLGDLARGMALSPRRLQELCRQQASCTPMELLRRQRLQALGERLRDLAHAGDSLGSLLADLKLLNSAATRHMFVELYGCTLEAWRQGQGQPGIPHRPGWQGLKTGVSAP